jgi:peptide/nickel transport system substrate-binding protein
MNRRDFLKRSAAAMATAGGLAAPSLVRAAGTKLLKFVPQTNLANLDPIWGTQYIVRNASLLIWDTLYGVDSKLNPKPQMAEGHEVSDEGRTWTFKLRAGLKFHDGEPVLSRDVIASLTRWMARDTMGQMINARLDALKTLDDRTFRFRLNKPFTKMLLALGKSNSPVACIMPEPRIGPRWARDGRRKTRRPRAAGTFSTALVPVPTARIRRPTGTSSRQGQETAPGSAG